MRKLVLGAAALLGLVALSPQGASAQGFSFVADFGGYDSARVVEDHRPPRVVEEYRAPRVVEEYSPPRRDWRDTSWREEGYRPHRRWGGWDHGRPVRYGDGDGYGGSRCTVRINRYFDGHATVTEKKRICR